jgi:hypothetical protein
MALGQTLERLAALQVEPGGDSDGHLAGNSQFFQTDLR